MKLLLDTNAFLFAITSPNKLPHRVTAALQAEAIAFLSVVSAWELTIKYQAGKLELPVPPSEFLRLHASIADMQFLDVTMDHLRELERLPMYHRDPFDRMLVAQARSEGLTIVSADRMLRRYDVDVMWKV